MVDAQKIEALQDQLAESDMKISDLMIANETLDTCWKQSEEARHDMFSKLEEAAELDNQSVRICSIWCLHFRFYD